MGSRELLTKEEARNSARQPSYFSQVHVSYNGKPALSYGTLLTCIHDGEWKQFVDEVYDKLV